MCAGSSSTAAHQAHSAALQQQLTALTAELTARDAALVAAGDALEDMEARLNSADRRATEQRQQQLNTSTLRSTGGSLGATAGGTVNAGVLAAEHAEALHEEQARYRELEESKNALEREVQEAEAWKVTNRVDAAPSVGKHARVSTWVKSLR